MGGVEEEIPDSGSDSVAETEIAVFGAISVGVLLVTEAGVVSVLIVKFELLVPV